MNKIKISLIKEQEPNIIKAYKNGYRIKDIQQQFNISEASVYRVLERNNIDRIRNSNSKNAWTNTDELINYYKQTESKEAVARKFNIGSALVDKILKANNIEIKHAIKKITLNEEQEIISFYLMPNTMTDTANKFNITHSRLYSILKKNNITLNDRAISNKVISEKLKIKLNPIIENNIIEYYKDHSIQETAEKFNITTNKIYQVLKEQHIQLKSFEKKNSNDKNISLIINAYQDNVLTTEEICKQFNITGYILYSILKENNIAQRNKTNAGVLRKIAWHKQLNITPELEQQIIKYYLSPNSRIDTAKHFNIPGSRVDKILKENNIQKHKGEIDHQLRSERLISKVSPSQELDIINFYLAPNTLTATSKKFKLNSERIKNILAKHNIQLHNQTVLNKIRNSNIEKIYLKYKETMYERYNSYHAHFKKYTYNNLTFDSFPELCFYLYHLKNNIFIKQEPIELKYLYNNKEYSYFPDFQIGKQLYEIKGPQFLKEDGTWQNPYDHSLDEVYEAKHQCAIKNNVKILYSRDYQQYIDWLYAQGYKKEDFIK